MRRRRAAPSSAIRVPGSRAAFLPIPARIERPRRARVQVSASGSPAPAVPLPPCRPLSPGTHARDVVPDMPRASVLARRLGDRSAASPAATSPCGPGRGGAPKAGQPGRAIRSARWRVSASAPGGLCAAPCTDDVRARPRDAGAVSLHRGAGCQGRDARQRSVRIRSRAHARLRGRSAGRRPGDSSQPERPVSRLQAGPGSGARGRARRAGVPERRPQGRRTIAGSMSDTRPTPSSTP